MAQAARICAFLFSLIAALMELEYNFVNLTAQVHVVKEQIKAEVLE